MRKYEKEWKYFKDTIRESWRRGLEARSRFNLGKRLRKRTKHDSNDGSCTPPLHQLSQAKNSVVISESTGTGAPIHCGMVSLESGSVLPQNAPANSKVESKSTMKKSVHNQTQLQTRSIFNDTFSLNNQIIELEIGRLERENYKLDLELLKLEKELKIGTSSKYTSRLCTQNDADASKSFLSHDLDAKSNSITQ